MRERYQALLQDGRADLAEPLVERELELVKSGAPTATKQEDIARMQARLAWVKLWNSKPAECEVLATSALATLEKGNADDPLTIAEPLEALVMCQRDAMKFAAASRNASRLVSVTKRLGPHHADSIRAIRLDAEINFSRGDYASARHSLEQVEKLYDEVELRDPQLRMRVIDQLARACSCEGDVAAADRHFARLLAVVADAYERVSPETALANVNIGGHCLDNGRYAEADNHFRTSLAIMQQLDPDSTQFFTGHVKMLVGRVAIALGKYDEADDLLREALAIKTNAAAREGSPPQMQQSIRTTKRHLADLYIDYGNVAADQPRAGLLLLEECLEKAPDELAFDALMGITTAILRSNGNLEDAQKACDSAERLAGKTPSPVELGKLLEKRAIIALRAGRFAEAAASARRCTDLVAEMQGPQGGDTVHALATQAYLEARCGDRDAALRTAQRQRMASRQWLVDKSRGLTLEDRLAFHASRDMPLLHGLVSLALRCEGGAERAAEWIANGKMVATETAAASVIQDAIENNDAVHPLVAELNSIRKQQATLSLLKPDAEQAANLTAELRSLAERERDVVVRMAALSPRKASEARWVTIEEIRRNLAPGTALIDVLAMNVLPPDFFEGAIGATTPPPASRYLAWVIPAAGEGRVKTVDLGDIDEINAAVAIYREAIEAVQKRGGTFPRGQAAAEEELKITAAALSTKVLQPIVAEAGEATELILSLDNALWLVPWQAVPLADGSYAIDTFTIRTVTSGRDLVPPPEHANAHAGEAKGPLIVADPAFDVKPPGKGPPIDTPARGLAPAGRVLPHVGRLVGTLAESQASAAALSKIFPSEPKRLTGASATEENVKKEAVRPPALVLATHGFFLPDQIATPDGSAGLAGLESRGPRAATVSDKPFEDPLRRCGLLLAGANITAAGKALPGEDGVLTGAEIVGLDLLGTDLVVLSACETGVGKVQNGEGVAGLRQAFQIAGAKSVVATLWQVPDAESGQIMQSFYANVAQGQTPSKALREAQLAFIKARREDRAAGEAAHPYLWAAYGVTGR